MSPVRATWRRTIGHARNVLTTAFAVGGFLAVVAVLVAFGLSNAEGSRLTLAALWATSVSPVLPVFAALLGMGVWSDEIQSGRIEVLLATAVRERDLVIGKFLGVLTLVTLTALLSLSLMLVQLALFAPQALGGLHLVDFLPALAGVFLQGVLWSAVSVASSAVFRHAAAAACASVVLTVGLPRAVWSGLRMWSWFDRTSFGDMPFDAHALDMASGVFPLGAVICYVSFSAILVLVATKCVALRRMVGRGAGGIRASTSLALILALVLAGVVGVFASHVGVVLDTSLACASSSLSQRTRNILSEFGGGLSVTCFLPRSDKRFRSTGRFLRLLKAEAEAVGVTKCDVRYVDPRFDIGAAERLVRRGITEDSMVFESGRRMVAVSFDEGFGEHVWATAIRRLTAGPRRRSVYWTIGHGELAFDEYGPFGMSDIARDLSRDGYRNQRIDLATTQQIPGDCAMIVIAGAKDAFSRIELGRVEAFLREGGRLLVLLGSAKDEGVASILPSWGIRPVTGQLPKGATLTGSDVIVSDFADPVSAPLRGSRIILEKPLSFLPSAAAETGAGADSIKFAPIASVGTQAFAVAVERGSTAGNDLAIRPTRIVAVGDAVFALNGQLQSRANANREFLLNCAAYLSGTDVVETAGGGADFLVVGMDRSRRLQHAACSVLVLPGAVVLCLAAVAIRRRRRI